MTQENYNGKLCVLCNDELQGENTMFCETCLQTEPLIVDYVNKALATARQEWYLRGFREAKEMAIRILQKGQSFANEIKVVKKEQQLAHLDGEKK